MSSPAAAAGITRILTDAGLKRARELAKGIEVQGFYASPVGDHVRVEFVPGPFADEADHERIIVINLATCKAVLKDLYDVTDATAQLAYPGEFRTLPVLEVRSAKWGR